MTNTGNEESVLGENILEGMHYSSILVSLWDLKFSHKSKCGFWPSGFGPKVCGCQYFRGTCYLHLQSREAIWSSEILITTSSTSSYIALQPRWPQSSYEYLVFIFLQSQNSTDTYCIIFLFWVILRPNAVCTILFYWNKDVIRGGGTKLSNDHLHTGGEGEGMTSVNNFLNKKL